MRENLQSSVWVSAFDEAHSCMDRAQAAVDPGAAIEEYLHAQDLFQEALAGVEDTQNRAWINTLMAECKRTIRSLRRGVEAAAAAGAMPSAHAGVKTPTVKPARDRTHWRPSDSIRLGASTVLLRNSVNLGRTMAPMHSNATVSEKISTQMQAFEDIGTGIPYWLTFANHVAGGLTKLGCALNSVDRNQSKALAGDVSDFMDSVYFVQADMAESHMTTDGAVSQHAPSALHRQLPHGSHNFMSSMPLHLQQPLVAILSRKHGKMSSNEEKLMQVIESLSNLLSDANAAALQHSAVEKRLHSIRSAVAALKTSLEGQLAVFTDQMLQFGSIETLAGTHKGDGQVSPSSSMVASALQRSLSGSPPMHHGQGYVPSTPPANPQVLNLRGAVKDSPVRRSLRMDEDPSASLSPPSESEGTPRPNSVNGSGTAGSSPEAAELRALCESLKAENAQLKARNVAYEKRIKEESQKWESLYSVARNRRMVLEGGKASTPPLHSKGKREGKPG